MRVITGSAKGTKLTAPPGLATRPTAARVKEAAFSAIQFEVEGARVLDLFAGSGQMGIEALSRGAKHCVFVDNARLSRAAIRENLARIRRTRDGAVVLADALAYLRGSREYFDIAFLDPPYASGLLPAALEALSGRMSGQGAILCEAPGDAVLPERAGEFVLQREYGHGKIKVALYRRAAAGIDKPGG